MSYMTETGKTEVTGTESNSTKFHHLSLLLYIQLTISFLLCRKRTVNFRNLHLGSHLAVDYTIIMSRTFKVTGNHVIYDHSA